MKARIMLVAVLLLVGRVGYKTHYCGLHALSLGTLFQDTCACSTADDWCANGYTCVSQGDICTPSNLGCGTLGLFSCNGHCWQQIQEARAQHSRPIRAALWVRDHVRDGARKVFTSRTTETP